MKLEKYDKLNLPEKFKCNESYFSELSNLGFYKYGDWSIIIGVDHSNIESRQHKAFAIHDEHGLYENSGGESHVNAIADLFRYDLIRLGVEFNDYFKPKYQYKSYDDTFIAIEMSDSEKLCFPGEYKILESHLYKMCCTMSDEGFIHFNAVVNYFIYPEQLLELYQLSLQVQNNNKLNGE